jgi:hypothetical protein
MQKGVGFKVGPGKPSHFLSFQEALNCKGDVHNPQEKHKFQEFIRTVSEKCFASLRKTSNNCVTYVHSCDYSVVFIFYTVVYKIGLRLVKMHSNVDKSVQCSKAKNDSNHQHIITSYVSNPLRSAAVFSVHNGSEFSNAEI